MISHYKHTILILYLLICSNLNSIKANDDGSGDDLDHEDDEEIKAYEKPILLTKESFMRTITEPEFGTFAMFHAPWCGHCKRMTSTWDTLAQRHNSKGKFLIAKVDCPTQAELCSDQDVLAYPTFIFFKKGSPAGVIYEGARDFESMDTYLMNQYYNDANTNEEESADADKDQNVPQLGVNVLNDVNFKSYVSTGFHFIKFYAPWWEELSSKYVDSKVKISKIDCTQSGETCQRIGIRGYPTLIFFANGQEVGRYQQERSVSAFTLFIDNMLTKFDRKSEPPKSIQKENIISNDNSVELLEKTGEVIEFNEQNFETARDKQGILFVKFYAPWCSHCKAMEGTWNELAKILVNNKNIRIGKVDCTKHERVCKSQGVEAYPTLYLYKDGTKMSTFLDSRNLENFKKFLKIYLPHDEL